MSDRGANALAGAFVNVLSGMVLPLAFFPDAVRPYRMPGAVWLSPLAFILANLIIYWSGFPTLWKLGICIVIGYVLIGVCMLFDPQRPKIDWKAAQWLPVYLIGMGIISWLGQFPTKGNGGAPPPGTRSIPGTPHRSPEF